MHVYISEDEFYTSTTKEYTIQNSDPLRN